MTATTTRDKVIKNAQNTTRAGANIYTTTLLTLKTNIQTFCTIDKQQTWHWAIKHMAIRPDVIHDYLLTWLSQVCTTVSLNNDAYTGKTDHLRHGPFDILGGAWVFFEKNFLAPILAKKNNFAQWHCEKNNLSPIVTQNSLIGMFEMSKPNIFSGSLRSPQ